MNGRIARKLRKVMEFKPHEERFYKCLNNANNYTLSPSGSVERIGGTYIEVTREGHPVTNRSKYNYMKGKYYDRAF